MCCGTEAGSCLRRIDSCITQLKAQGPSRTCNESKEEEEEEGMPTFRGALVLRGYNGVGVSLVAGCGGSESSLADVCSYTTIWSNRHLYASTQERP